MATEIVIGLDVGTQSSKLVTVSADGHILAEERIAHGVSRPKPGYFEQDAEAVWWRDVVALLSRIAARPDLTPRALAVSGIGPTALPTREDGTPLRPGILYGIDTRAQAETAALEARLGREATVEICGSALSSQSPVPKLLWLKAHEPEVFRAMRRWFTAHAWLAYRLTGAYAVDHHSASQFVPLYDVAAARWRDDLWRELLPRIETPALAWPGESIGTITVEASAATGLAVGLPVVMGTIDAWAEAYSAFADAPGTGMIMYGSTYFFVANSDSFVASERFWGTRSVRRNTFSLAGGMATGGLVLNWLARLFATDVTDVLARALAGRDDVAPIIATPYLAGERTPFSDPNARGVLFGMDLDTDADQMCRAFVLGLALAVRDNLHAMHEEIGGGRDYMAVGGGAESMALLQLISDVAGVTQSAPRRTIGAALGDARLAAEAIGWEVSAEAWNPIERIIRPAVAASAYDAMFARFKELYRATKRLAPPGER